MVLGGSIALMNSVNFPANAGVFDGLVEAKRITNSKYMLGPIRLSRMRLADAKELASGAGAIYVDAQAKLRYACLDCIVPEDNLTAFAKFRDVCTYGIVLKSVTKGPAAKNGPDTANGVEAFAAFDSALSAMLDLDRLLEVSTESNPEDVAAVDASFLKLFAAVDRFELAIQACMGFEPDLALDLNSL
ncbi:hypothetical protein CYMTET_11322 [Cymbomonas tetramitiformis]|uniref:Uncharacterized protein n=1 Tax=Cymbomonas tetramitiformis TaxID=36881 RepID=A0AAE0GMY6_9CHLO|nr:hypothetical protein CYMTET_11322 [Cymbomonas tetramitiformis]